MLYVGLVAGVVAGNVAAHAVGIDAFRAYVTTLVLIPLALVGTRLLHVASYWRVYRRTPGRIWDRNDAGFAMYGGLPVALLLSVPLLAVLSLAMVVASLAVLMACWPSRAAPAVDGGVVDVTNLIA